MLELLLERGESMKKSTNTTNVASVQTSSEYVKLLLTTEEYLITGKLYLPIPSVVENPTNENLFVAQNMAQLINDNIDNYLEQNYQVCYEKFLDLGVKTVRLICYSKDFIHLVEKQLNENYIYQLTNSEFDWCNKFCYDFYIFKYNMIIEINGLVFLICC